MQGYDRYAYVNNNPVRYTDPSGHICVENDGSNDEAGMAGNCGGKANPNYKPGLQGSASGYVGGSRSRNASYTYDTMEIASYIPFTTSQWGSFALFLDEVALTLDTIAGFVVLGHVVLGSTLLFEGVPAGPAGGYIIGELNTATRVLVNAGNVSATFATIFGLVQALKDGSHRNVTTLIMNQDSISISSQSRISGNVVLSVGLTEMGWAAQPVSLSLPVQVIAVQNDRGNIPLPAIEITVDINIPFR